MINTPHTEVIGGGGYPGFGFGGIAPIGLIGLNNLFGRGYGEDKYGAGAAIPERTENLINIADLRSQVSDVAAAVAASTAAINQNSNAEFRNLDSELCSIKTTALQTAYQQSLQAFQNTQAIQNQVTAFQIHNDQEFCSIKGLVAAEAQATRALIEANKIQDLRDELDYERRSKSDIIINNNNNQIQSSINQVAQVLAGFSGQLASAKESIVNFGSMIGTRQSESANTVK